jgi:hypothetical protein
MNVFFNLNFFVLVSKNIFQAGWAEWAPWSCCSVTCGDVPGHHVRTRKCQGAEIGSSYCPCGGVLAGDNTCTSLTQSCQNMYIPKAGDTGYFETKSCQVESACRKYLTMHIYILKFNRSDSLKKR